MGSEIVCRSLNHSFGALPIIDRVDLRIRAGEFASILGPSGCGKSTLLKIIAGLIPAPVTEVEVLHSISREVKSAVGFVFQDPRLLPWRTVLENVAVPLELLGHSAPEARSIARAHLEKARYTESVDAYPSELSGGMKMRVSLARALSVNPSLLLLDEPFSALDDRSRHELQVDLKRLCNVQRMTVVFVTHQLAEAVFLASRLFVFSKRPARLVVEEKIDLPAERPSDLRMSFEYLNELKRIHARIHSLNEDSA